MRICIDTNLLISYALAPFSDSPPTRIVQALLEGSIELVLPQTVITELARKVESKPYLRERISSEFLNEIIELLGSIATIVLSTTLKSPPAILRDPKDSFLLATSVLEQVDYLVSGDRDLLVLGEVAGVKILSPRHFADLLEKIAFHE